MKDNTEWSAMASKLEMVMGEWRIVAKEKSVSLGGYVQLLILARRTTIVGGEVSFLVLVNTNQKLWHLCVLSLPNGEVAEQICDWMPLDREHADNTWKTSPTILVDLRINKTG